MSASAPPFAEGGAFFVRAPARPPGRDVHDGRTAAGGRENVEKSNDLYKYYNFGKNLFPIFENNY